jgi:hypothetical protein
VEELRSVDLDSFSCVRPASLLQATAGHHLGLESFDRIMPDKKMHEVVQMSRFVANLYQERGCRCLGNDG